MLYKIAIATLQKHCDYTRPVGIIYWTLCHNFYLNRCIRQDLTTKNINGICPRKPGSNPLVGRLKTLNTTVFSRNLCYLLFLIVLYLY